jgi:hypothetical protein
LFILFSVTEKVLPNSMDACRPKGHSILLFQ